MNPADDYTVPLGATATVQTSTTPPVETITTAHISSHVADLINTPKNPQAHLLPPVYPPKQQSDPSVAAGVQDLKALFSDTLAPSEVAFFAGPPKPPRQQEPPKNFLQAHTIIIDALLVDPSITMTALATVTGYSRNWLHRVINSDAFQAKFAARQNAIVDPLVHAAIKDRIQGIASRSLEILEDRLEGDKVSLDAALAVFGATSKAMGMGVKDKAPVVAQQFIVHVPPRMADAPSWASLHSGRAPASLAEPVDITPLDSATSEGGSDA